jgi:hypothetical protein
MPERPCLPISAMCVVGFEGLSNIKCDRSLIVEQTLDRRHGGVNEDAMGRGRGFGTSSGGLLSCGIETPGLLPKHLAEFLVSLVS